MALEGTSFVLQEEATPASVGGALAHALGHAMGAVLHIPHGRSVGLLLPYVVEYTVRGAETRYADIAHFLHLPADGEAEGAASLVSAIRQLQGQIDFATSIQDLGIDRQDFEAALPQLIANAQADNQLFFNARFANAEDLRRLFTYAYEGRSVDF